MSREERKMAQIIASIERMEQAPAGKSKKSKGEGKSKGRRVKASPSSPSDAPGRKLTPKKRWIQLWSAHLQDASSDKDEAEGPLQATPEREDGREDAKQAQEAASDGPGDDDKQEVTPVTASEAVEAEKPAAPTETRTAESEGLRVKTPAHSEASHLSPPVERGSSPSAAAASISPSAKAKEDESPPASNTSLESASTAASVAASGPSKDPTEDPTEPAEPLLAPATEEKRSGATLVKAKSTSSLVSDTRTADVVERESRKRSLERDPSTMTEEERRRAERRRTRKSNWDVGDPRFGGSPATSADGASPFGRLPLGRPTWRHSGSLDVKNFPPYRSSFHNNGPPPPSATAAGPRRGFYHSTSLPLDRSRSAGRSSRYGYGGSSYR